MPKKKTHGNLIKINRNGMKIIISPDENDDDASATQSQHKPKTCYFFSSM